LHNIEALLTFAGIPALVVAVVTIAVYAGGSRRSRRYRPGRPFEFTPVWFLAAPERQMSAGNATAAVTGAHRAALPAAATARRSAAASEPAQPVAGGAIESTGGASDRW
jgi:hypothetical protein